VFSVSADPNLGEAGASFGEARGLARLGVGGSSQDLDPEPTAPGMRSECKRLWIRPVDEGPNPSGLL
jgi:hypothetical protein